MSGIMAAVAGTGQNVTYANGLFNTSYGVELSPIDIGTQSSQGGVYSVTYQWIGYYRPATSSAIQLGAVCNYAEYYNFSGGGSGPTRPTSVSDPVAAVVTS